MLTPTRLWKRPETAFSLVEVLTAITLMAVFASIAVNMVSSTSDSARTTKLTSEVRKLNTILEIYVSEGGSLEDITDPQAVLDKLKTSTSAQDAQRQVGMMTGRGVDVRLVARTLTADETNSSAARAVWNPATSQFSISYTPGQAGITFDLDNGLAGHSYGTESRAPTRVLYNGSNGWVWAPGDHQALASLSPDVFTVTSDSSTGSPPTTVPFDPGTPTDPPTDPPPPQSPPPTPLPIPIITPPGGLFFAANFPSAVTIDSNHAPTDSSVLKYFIVHSDGSRTGWETYSGAVPIIYGDTVTAQNQSLDSAHYRNSGMADETYAKLPAPPIVGSMTPTWVSPLGGSNLVDTIDNSNSSSIVFTHGSPVSSQSAATGNIPVADPSFESPTSTTVNGPFLLGTKNGTIGSWNYSISTLLGLGGASISFGSGGSVAPVDGSQVAKLQEPGLAGVISTVDLYQTVSGVTLAPNTTYTLMFDMAGPSNLIQLLSNVSASITVGGSKVASLSNWSLLSLLNGPNTMTPVELSFTTGATVPTGALGVDFSMTNLANVGTAILYLDEVRLEAGSANFMRFVPASLNTTPDVPFTLGQLSVYDGVTFDNSAATGVTLHLNIALSSLGARTIPVDVHFTITTPASGVSGNDTVTLSNPTTNGTLTIGGITYTLNVSMAMTDTTKGSLSGNTLTILPGKTALVQLNGVWQSH